jgi:glycosyltransferase involved in cell wall biosynthesis
MSVVFVSPLFEIFSPTGSSSIAMVEYDLCRAAQRRGIQPFVTARRSHRETFDWPRLILLDAPKPQPKSPQWWRARIERKLFGGANLGDYTFVKRIARAISAQKLERFPIIVHGHAQPAIWLRQKFPRAFIAFWCHGGISFDKRERENLKAAINLAIGVSSFQGCWLQEYFGLPASQVATVFNGIDADLFSPPQAARSTPDVLTITYLGRIHRDKGLDILLRAALEAIQTQATQSARAVQIKVIGSDQWEKRACAAQYRTELDATARELEQRGVKIEWLGHVGREAVPGLLRQSDIHVVPTRCDEAFGLSTIEGMACGVATVASSTGGTPEVVGDAALLFERENVPQLAKLLQKLIKDEALRREYSRRGRTRALEFPRERMWSRLCEVIPAVAGGGA